MKMILALPCLYFMVSIFFTTVFWIHVKSLGGRVQSLFERKRAIWFFSLFIHVGSFLEWSLLYFLRYMWENLLTLPVPLSPLVFLLCTGSKALIVFRIVLSSFVLFDLLDSTQWIHGKNGPFFGRILSLWCNRYITRVAIEKQARLHKTHTDVTIHKSALRAKHANIVAAVKHVAVILVSSHPMPVMSEYPKK